MQSRTIGLVGGSGWLGSAIGRALLSSGFVAPDDLWISNRSGRRSGFDDWPHINFTTESQELVDACGIVVLSVLPQDFSALAIDARDRLVVSVMAGANVRAIAAQTGAERIVRAMPNAAAEVRLSYTPWYATDPVTTEDRDVVQGMFESCGRADRVPVEDQIDYFTALTGPGPAFLAFFADAMIQHAAGAGVDPRIAERAVHQLFRGGSVLLADSTESPAEIVQTFVDYAGTTAAGLEAMRNCALAEDIGRGIEAAYTSAKTILTD